MSTTDLSLKIRDLRAKHGLTLEQVAQQVGVGKSTVRKWETGMIANMRRDKIEKLAAALHTSPGYLMGWESEEDASISFIASPPSRPDSTVPEIEIFPRAPHVSDSCPLSPEEEEILYKYHHGKLLSDMTEEEITIIKKFRRLDDRGKSSVLNILNHEYDSLPGEIPSPAPKKA